MTKPAKRLAIFDPEFRDDLAYWVKTDRKAASRTLERVEAVMADPLIGIGKPEPLRFELAGCSSRRVAQENRLVCRVSADSINFLQARNHYQWAQ
jgi:toxin YoeB